MDMDMDVDIKVSCSPDFFHSGSILVVLTISTEKKSVVL